jgi:hypothetical protein
MDLLRSKERTYTLDLTPGHVPWYPRWICYPEWINYGEFPLTIARAHLVDPAVSRWYHCVTRCVRRAFLLGEGDTDRKQWIENRLQDLAQLFAVSLGGFTVLDNHLHVLVRLDPEVAGGWSDEEVVRRWGGLFPPRDKARQPLPVSDAWVQGRLQDPAWVAMARQRLQSLSWFMKCLKEPLSRLVNRQENVRGAFLNGPSYCLHCARLTMMGNADALAPTQSAALFHRPLAA